MTWSYR